MTSSSLSHMMPKSRNLQTTSCMRVYKTTLICAVMCSFLFLASFKNILLYQTLTFLLPRWRKWRDSALRHRGGHILEAEAALFRSASVRCLKNIFFHNTSFFFGGAGERLGYGRLRAAMQQPTPKKPWSRPGTRRRIRGWKNSDVAWHASK